MANKQELVQRLLKATGQAKLEDAVAAIERIVPVAATQNHILSNLGVLTIVFGPTGMGLFTVNPQATASLEGLATLEKAVLDFQAALLERRNALLAAKAAPQDKKE